MTVDVPDRATRVLVVVNLGSGNQQWDRVRAALDRCADQSRFSFDYHHVSPDENLHDVIRAAVRDGCELVIAAGGDGTVSTVAQALVNSPARLGILPLGTTNVLARELAIPLDIDAACDLLAGENRTAEIDAMQVGEAYYFTQIGVGVDALMIRDTTTPSKKRFGVFAYLWTAGSSLAGFQPRRFTIAVDSGQAYRTRASQVAIINSGALGSSGLRWCPHSRVDDGQVEVCVVKARTVVDYLRIGWSVIRRNQHQERCVSFMTASRSVKIQCDHRLPAQGDGELLGETPIEVRVVSRALSVAVSNAMASN